MLLFVHDEEAEVRGGEIGWLICNLECRTYDGDKMGRGGMVFFSWGDLRLFAVGTVDGGFRSVTAQQNATGGGAP